MAGPYQPLSAPVPAPVVVVSPQFCSPDVVPLTVTKKVASLSGGDFTVTDANGAVELQVKGSFFTVRNRRVLLDAAGQPVLSMHEKVNSPRGRQLVFFFSNDWIQKGIDRCYQPSKKPEQKY